MKCWVPQGRLLDQLSGGGEVSTPCLYPTVNPSSHLDVLSRGNKQVGGFARLAEGKACHRVTPFMENLGLAVPIPRDISFCQYDAPIRKACRRKGSRGNKLHCIPSY